MLVIFDCDGVLVDSEALVNRVEATFLSAKGWSLSPLETRALFKGKTTTDVIRAVRERTGASDDEFYDLAMRTAQTLVDELLPVPGIVDVLEHLHRRDVAMCVASQSPLARVLISLKVCGINSFFEGRVFTASMVARPKPAPDLFIHAAHTLGFQPERCVVVEDSPTGVCAAVSAGMRVLGYAADESPEHLRAAGATTFTRMSELPALLGVT